MSATTKSRRQSQAATKAKAAKAKPTKATARKPKQAEPEADANEVRSQAISAGMKELAAVRTKAREKRNGVPAKPMIWDEFLKALLAGKAFDVAVVAKKYPDVKESTIRAWVAYWRSHPTGEGSGFPSNARSTEVRAKFARAMKKAKVA